MERILLLSGAMGAGKTAVAAMLESGGGFQRLSTSGYLRQYGAGLGPEGQRQQLQDLGDRLDLETDYRWVVDDVALPSFARWPDAAHWLLDAARKPRQVTHFRAQFGPMVRHVHLTAPDGVLRERYTQRSEPADTPYDKAIRHPNEVAARGLLGEADHVFDTSTMSTDQVVARIQTMWEC
ncbi:AAA family ATPase [Luteibacter sp. CQ10]|uniref:AAA family ATPase n=1 Tax=Luteibacter sp. CQ10 TaxID=2805821 RepID=UPI0034A5C011